MAQKEGIIIILILICTIVFAHASLAIASQEDIKKFPPISGEIYGQAVPGLKSLYINGKKIPFDEDFNFRTQVNLKAGQKYLTLVLDYEGIRIIKKYLVLRKAEVKKFKIVVPREKIEKAVEAAKRPTREEILRKRRERALALARKKKERERLLRLKQEEVKRKKELAERRWIKETASPRFHPHEFILGPSPEVLVQAIETDNYGLNLKNKGSIEKLNEILQIPNFYDLLVLRKKRIPLTQQLKNLIIETKSYRSKSFASLNLYQKKKIMVLNRLLIEALYPSTPKKKTWLAEELKLPTVPKTCEYLYVWEFSEGKLLLVKETKGKYSAEIHIPVSKEWLDLKGISAKELKEIIGTPVTTTKQIKKK